MSEIKPFKILSIDGGGIKGLYSAIILQRFEEEFCKENETISDYFDMICGTSTGGLIALALSLKIPAKEIVDFYKNEGNKIFPFNNFFTRTYAFFKQLLFSAKYSNKPLKRALEKVLSDKKMKDANNLLCIPSYNLSLGRTKIFKSPFYHIENPWKFDMNKLMSDVALATSAAPTYFPIHQIEADFYADGGVWANNPTLCGFLEALKFFLNHHIKIDNQEIKYSSAQILSISSVSQPTGWKTNSWILPYKIKSRSASLWLRSNKLLQPFMEGQNYFTNFFMSSIAQKYDINYLRIEHKPLSYEQTSNVDLDKASKSAIQQLESIAEDTARFYYSSHKQEIEPFFNSKKTYKF